MMVLHQGPIPSQYTAVCHQKLWSNTQAIKKHATVPPLSLDLEVWLLAPTLRHAKTSTPDLHRITACFRTVMGSIEETVTCAEQVSAGLYQGSNHFHLDNMPARLV